jgi:3-deoxy-7-phosphoheptulonate synthase
MIIQMQPTASEKNLQTITETLERCGIAFKLVNTQNSKYIVGIGPNDIDLRKIGHLDGVKDIHQVTDSFQLVSSQWKVGRSAIKIADDSIISEHDFTVIAGPCSVENEEQVMQIADYLVQKGVKIMRGGVFKPRSSPYAFRGLGIEGLKMFHSICQSKGISIISEVMQVSQIEEMHDYIDIFQIGARNTQNFNLLDALGEVEKPVLLKRGISGSINELLQSAEYIFSAGNENILLCERGIRTFENAYRNTFDINAIPILKEKSHLPVIADPSHGIGIRKHVPRITLAAMLAGADGAIVELHPIPEKAKSDGQQTLNFEEFDNLMNAVNELKQIRI